MNRAAFGPRTADLADISAMGPYAWIDSQINWQKIPDASFRAAFATYRNSLPNWKILRNSFIYTALFTQRQLQARMSYFWETHFNTDLNKVGRRREQAEYRDFMRVCMEPFASILRTSAQSPAMLIYLDNDHNRNNASNENYARELLELHTLGVDGGYTDNDVIETARVFTGWRHLSIGEDRRIFEFRAAHHDTGPKTVLGWSTPGISGDNGVEEGRSLLRYLASHPATGRFVGGKLTRYFVDDPPQHLLDQVGGMITDPRNSVGDVLRVILRYVADTVEVSRDKSMDPLEWCVSQARRLEDPSPSIDTLRDSIEVMGLTLFRFPVPTGQPESGPKWESSSQLLQRWGVAHRIDAGSYNGADPDWTTVLGTPAPTTKAQLLDRMVLVMLDGDLQPGPRAILARWLDKTLPANPTAPQLATAATALVGLLLRLPEAQLN